jgi:RNA polymerase primary sigma factor
MLLQRYFAEIRHYPPLSREREAQLAHDVEQGSPDALNELIQCNLSFVVKVASEYRNLGLPFEDLLNEGNLGLIEAARRYDASKGTKFITYAIWWIRKSILKALSDRSSLVRVPTYQIKKVREIRETERTLRRQLGRAPRREEISASLERSLSKVDQALQFNLREVSLEAPVGKHGDQQIADYLADENCGDAEAALIRREETSIVAEALRELTEQEKTVVRYRFGLVGGQSRTLNEVGRLMNISRERVRQIEVKAKQRMREVFDSRRAIRTPDKAPYPSSRHELRDRDDA